MYNTSESPARGDVYRAVTDSIIAAIEAGAGTFVMPWHGGRSIAKPQNAATRMEYHGINVLALWAEAWSRGFRSGYWASYRQWQSVGGQVVKGAVGSTIVFFKRLESEEGEQEEKSAGRLFARASRVFNADQVAGWEPAAEQLSFAAAEPLEAVEAFVSAAGPEVHHGGTSACYHPDDDYIQIPLRTQFTGSLTSSPTEAYYSTLLHELVHWTGAKHRLDRLDAVRNKRDLAAEELVAEIGAAFLCADLGVSNEPRADHAAYVANWLQILRNDTRAIFTASRLANQAAMFLHELTVSNN